MLSSPVTLFHAGGSCFPFPALPRINQGCQSIFYLECLLEQQFITARLSENTHPLLVYSPAREHQRDISIAVINSPAPGREARPSLGAELHQFRKEKKGCFGKVELCWKSGWTGENQGGSLEPCTGLGMRKGELCQWLDTKKGTAAKLWENDCSSVSSELSSLTGVLGIFLFQMKAQSQNK